ncbi:MAG TPA: glycosyltransferase [Thermoanaerobaculia bacterium]|nr:glycosyltransferase [Thermoanaerobaculia bacterium]
MAKPVISVIVRTLGDAHLDDALASLAAQTRRDFEVVVVDMSGGANVRTLERFASLLRLRVVALPRCSRPKALNAGIAMADGAVIAILDDDNLYDPEQIEIFLTGLERTKADYVYAGVRHATYSASGERIAVREVARPFVFGDLLMGNFIYATGSAFRKSLWERIGGYDERFEVFEDWDFLIRAAQAGTIEFLGIVSGESRKFTGIDGASAFDLEIARVRRCHAGIYWKHRRHYLDRQHRGAFRSTSAEHFARRNPPRRGLLAMTIRGWRLELFADLVAWFVHNLRGVHRSD